MKMMKRVKDRCRKGLTLVELVVTIAVTAIMLSMLGVFLFFFISTNNQMAIYRETYQNADMIALNIGRFIDTKNDGKLSMPDSSNPSETEKLSSYDPTFCIPILAYEEEIGKKAVLYYDEQTDRLMYHDQVYVTSDDENLTISTYWNDDLVRITLTYGEKQDSLSFIKTIY